MSLDHETTTPEAAAQYERDHTPAYDDEQPDRDDVGATVEGDPRFIAWLHDKAVELARLRYEQTRRPA